MRSIGLNPSQSTAVILQRKRTYNPERRCKLNNSECSSTPTLEKISKMIRMTKSLRRRWNMWSIGIMNQFTLMMRLADIWNQAKKRILTKMLLTITLFSRRTRNILIAGRAHFISNPRKTNLAEQAILIPSMKSLLKLPLISTSRSTTLAKLKRNRETG